MYGDADPERMMMIEQCRELTAEVARLRESLEFYANPQMWMETKLTPVTSPDGSVYLVQVPILLEMGLLARTALSAAPPSEASYDA